MSKKSRVRRANASKTIRLETGTMEARLRYAHLLEGAGLLDDAEQEYKAVSELMPESADPYIQYGNLLKRIRRYEDAEKQYCKAIRVNPGNFHAHFSYAVLLEEQKRFAEAEDEYILAAGAQDSRAST